jgi:malate synthase
MFPRAWNIAAMNAELPTGLELRTHAATQDPRFAEILSSEALAFVADLARNFRPRLRELLQARAARAARLLAGEERFDFLESTKSVREGDWRVAKVPADIEDRRVEITGPPDRKMVINALNSGARVFMADFEDSSAPTWNNQIEGQLNLKDAVRRSITFEGGGKKYELGANPAVLFVRPRGLHLEEKHCFVDGDSVPGSLFDFGLFFFHNAKEQLARGTAPYFYLPKLESHLEARLWNDVFVAAQKALGLPLGTVKATVLIETLPAAFEMDEILFELREHSAGLNCGRWDYIFSFIKKAGLDPKMLLPDRSQVTMDKAFLAAYSRLLIQTCHKRGAHAMGGMAAQIPIKNDPEANNKALENVRRDKLREVTNGHDGTWVAHPGLVPIAMEIFNAHMTSKNQLDKPGSSDPVTREALLEVHQGSRTDAGFRHNLRVGVQYVESWLRGVGCVPIYNLMEDAATAEISRAQVWQWLHLGATTEDGAAVTRERFERTLAEELERVKTEVGEARFTNGKFPEAAALFARLSLEDAFVEFLTLPAYDALLTTE